MAKFLIQSVFALPKELVLVGVVQEGTINVGMKSTDLELMTVSSIEKFNKKIESAETGSNVGLKVNRLKKMATEGLLTNKMLEFK
jgi:translation elongation factor EF-Tu-like GTPase